MWPTVELTTLENLLMEPKLFLVKFLVKPPPPLPLLSVSASRACRLGALDFFTLSRVICFL